MKQVVRGRFAPSPTGYMHMGNLWIAMLSYVSVRQQGGQWILRIEDIDRQRSQSSYTAGLLQDLDWLGFQWDEGPYQQSRRQSLYESVLQQLEAHNLVYPCYCSRARLHNVSSAPHLGEKRHPYDGHCRELSLAERDQLAKNKKPSYRLKVEDTRVQFHDAWQGLQTKKLKAGYDDFVIRRADGMWAYNLAVVIDDLVMGVTEVVRGCDLLDVTAQQIYLRNQLRAVCHQESASMVIHYKQAPVLLGQDGHRLSKRQHSVTIKDLRESGYTPAMVWSHFVEQVGLGKALSERRRVHSLSDLLTLDLNSSLFKQEIIYM